MDRDRHGKIAFAVLLAATFNTNIASTMLVPLVPDLIGRFRMSDMAIGLAFTGFPFARALAQPVGGVFADRTRRLVLLTGMGLLAVAITVTGTGFARTGEQVVFWRLAWGVTAGVVIPAIYRLMFLLAPRADLSPAQATSRFGSAAVSGMAVGPGLVWLLHKSVSFAGLFVIGGCCTAVSGVVLVLAIRSWQLTPASEPAGTERRARFYPGWMTLLGLVALFGLIDLVNNGAYAWLEPVIPIQLHRLTGSAASGLTSLFFTAGLVVFAVISAVSGKKIERHAELTVATSGLCAAAVMILGIAATAWVAVIGACFIGFMATQPVVYVVVRRGVNRVPADRLGRAFGLFGLLSDLGYIAGPVLGTVLYSRFGTNSFLLLGAAIGSAAVLCLALRGMPDRLLGPAPRDDEPAPRDEEGDQPVATQTSVIPHTKATGVRQFLAHRSPASGIYVDTGEAEPTMEAMRWAAEITRMLGDRFDDDMLAFIAACRRSDLYAMRADQFEPELGATYYATRVFTLANRRDLVPADIVAGIAGHVFAANGLVSVNVDDLFYGVRAMEQAGAPLSPPQAVRAVEFIDACAAPPGGYSLRPGDAPDIERTYCCLRMRSILSEWSGRTARDEARAKRDATWVSACVREKAVFLSPESAATSLAITYWGTHAARLCGLAFPWAQVDSAIASAWRPDGGFGDDRSTLWSTYCALRLLELRQSWPGWST